MRIMFAVGSYWPSQDGVAMITKYLVEGLRQKGHDVFVFTSAGDGGRQILPKEEVYNNVPIKRMRVFVRWPMKLKGIDKESTPQRYLEEIRNYDPDILVVICSQTWTLDWILPHLDELRCKKVFYSHGFSAMKDEYPIKRLLKQRNVYGAISEYKVKKYYETLDRYLRKFDRLIAISELNNSYIYCKERGLEIIALENAIQKRFIEDDMCHKYDEDKEDIQFLYVANYNYNKNQEMLLKAFCNANIDNCRLVFTGFEENDYLRELRQKEAEWNRSDNCNTVEFNVRLSRDEIYELYKKSDVFISTSRSENSPIVHREAAATGMAVISTDVGDVRLLDGIILINNDDELRSAIERLYTDRQELKERGTRLRNCMLEKKSTIEDKTQKFEEELLELMG